MTLSNDKSPASLKELSLILEKYCSLLHEQLSPLGKTLEKMTSSLQKEIQALMDAADAKAEEANQIYIKKDGDQEGFSKITLKKLNKSTAAPTLDQKQAIEHLKLRVANWSQDLSLSGVSLKSEMEKLKNVNDELQNWMMSMVGILSMEDVISQRLQHAEKALMRIKQFLAVFESGNTRSMEDVEHEINKVMLDVFKNFTMEQQKIVFRKYFGSIDKKSA